MGSALDKIVALSRQSSAPDALLFAAGDDDDGSDVFPGADDIRMLAEACDASLDEACRLFRGADITSCPPEVQQGIYLAYAAAVVSDGMLDALGAHDPDDGDTGEFSARLSWVERTAYDPLLVRLADSDAGTSQGAGETYADSGRQADGKKRYPVTLNGKLNPTRIRAAWSYINQKDNADQYSAADLAIIKGKIKSAARRAGVEISDDSDSGGKAA
jgi:hypothetical protein